MDVVPCVTIVAQSTFLKSDVQYLKVRDSISGPRNPTHILPQLTRHSLSQFGVLLAQVQEEQNIPSQIHFNVTELEGLLSDPESKNGKFTVWIFEFILTFS